MKKLVLLLNLVLLMFLLTGCLYPQEKMKQNETPYPDQLQSVQRGVDAFKTKTDGMLPIQTREISTPIYQKYPIDFNRLIPDYIANVPGNSYESGGVFQYVLVDVEKNPTVKLLDLRLSNKMSDLMLRLDLYRQQNQYPPFKESITPHVYTLDYKKMGYDNPPVVVSPYTGKNLSFVINDQGELFIDYRPDLFEKLKSNPSIKEGEDILDILLKDSPFVPAYSLPYTVKDGEPVFLIP